MTRIVWTYGMGRNTGATTKLSVTYYDFQLCVENLTVLSYFSSISFVVIFKGLGSYFFLIPNIYIFVSATVPVLSRYFPTATASATTAAAGLGAALRLPAVTATDAALSLVPPYPPVTLTGGGLAPAHGETRQVWA